MNDRLIMPEKTVRAVETPGPESATEGPADTLSVRLSARDGSPEGKADLHGFYNINAERLGRVGGRLPDAILAVVVVRETGLVFVMRMMNSEQMPPLYDADALPSIARENAPADAALPSRWGHFTSNLNMITDLSSAGATLDGFLWLEDVHSDMVSLILPSRDPNAILPAPRRTATDRSEISSADGIEAPTLIFDGSERRLRGTSPGSTVSIAAISLPDMEIGTAVLSQENAPGLTFDVPISAILPNAPAGARILAFAIAQGQKSDLAYGVLPK